MSLLTYFTENMATYPPAVWCNSKGVHFVPVRLGIPFKWELWKIDKIENETIFPGTKIYKEFTTYENNAVVLSVFDNIIKIYNQLALKK